MCGALEGTAAGIQCHEAATEGIYKLLLLLPPLQAGLEQLPTQPSQVLDKHTDEVWAVQFSHDGRHLASAAKDGCVILWCARMLDLLTVFVPFVP